MDQNLTFGKLNNIGEEISKIQNSGSVFIITDRVVGENYLKTCQESIEKQGLTTFTYELSPGEGSKTGETYLDILNSMAESGLTRTDSVLALGGGVVGDIGGFAAATYMRGIKVYQVPTTLLAMVDSSIGGKTAIDLKTGKNLAGAFHMPSLIYQDLELLSTLPEEELLNGMAEIIKYGILVGGEFFDLLAPQGEGDIEINKLIELSCNYKMDIVSRDAEDHGERQLLNLGHTFGHGIEALSDFTIKHGMAVAMGLSIIADISWEQGWCDRVTRDKIIGILDLWGYDLEVPYLLEDIFQVIKMDKKRKGDEIDLVVPEEIGNCVLKRISMKDLEEMI